MRNRPVRTGLDALLPAEEAPTSIIDDVIASDRERNGRPHPARQAHSSETNVTTLQRSNEGPHELTNVQTHERSNGTTFEGTNVSNVGPVAPEPFEAAPKTTGRQPSEERTKNRGDKTSTDKTDGNELAARRERATRMAADDEIAVVTVRVSTKLNEYMDRYVARVNQVEPKRKYRKQDAVGEAFAAFFAEHPLPPAPEEEEL